MPIFRSILWYYFHHWLKYFDSLFQLLDFVCVFFLQWIFISTRARVITYYMSMNRRAMSMWDKYRLVGVESTIFVYKRKLRFLGNFLAHSCTHTNNFNVSYYGISHNILRHFVGTCSKNIRKYYIRWLLLYSLYLTGFCLVRTSYHIEFPKLIQIFGYFVKMQVNIIWIYNNLWFRRLNGLWCSFDKRVEQQKYIYAKYDIFDCSVYLAHIFSKISFTLIRKNAWCMLLLNIFSVAHQVSLELKTFGNECLKCIMCILTKTQPPQLIYA